MGTTHLPIFSESAPAPVPVDPFAAPEEAMVWRWCPDAKIMPGANGMYNICNFASGKIVAVDERQGRLLTRVSGLSIPFKMPGGMDAQVVDDLNRYGFILPEGDLERYEATIRARIARKLEQSHGLIIMPTEKCNYRCTYCYESFEKGRMAADAAEAVSKAIRRVAEKAEQFSLSFFGGEPLLCSDLVVRFSQEALEVCARRGLPYAAQVTTNGHFLTPELFEKLVDSGVVLYQITVDGDRKLHDQQRVTIKGDPTFDRILGNLRAMARSKLKFHCVVRCNSRPGDHERILALADEDLGDLRGDPRFSLSLHTIWSSDRQDMGGAAPRPSQIDGCGAPDVVRPIDKFFLNRELASRGLRTGLYPASASGMASSCYAGKPNWFVVGSDLSLYKCTVVFDREENKVGRVNPDGTFTIDQEKQQLWTGSNALTDSSCSTCHLRVPCSGLACPLKRFSTGHKQCPDSKNIDRLRVWSKNRPA